MKQQEGYTHVTHTFSPVYDERSRVLILGSFPSVKSREQNFYYGHPQNRFWKVIAEITKHGIAVWDVIASCDIIGSSDSSIKNVTVNDIEQICHTADLQKVYANGTKAYDLYRKYMSKERKDVIEKLPSTSPANAAWQFDRLCKTWAEAIGQWIL